MSLSLRNGMGMGMGAGGGKVVTSRLGLLFYPDFSLPGGIYDADTEAPLSLVLSAIAGEITYTSDNTPPNKDSTKYVNPIIISETTTIKAQAWAGMKYSHVGERTYKILPPDGYTENTLFANSEDVFGWNSTDTITFGRTEV